LGNGFRFGISYMYGSMAANGISFILVALTTPYWRQEWQFAAGLLAAIVAIPIYTSSLIRKLRSSMALAKAASKAKTEFLSMISHELRTPLNTILGLAQISRETAASDQESKDAAYTEIAANRLKHMLDTILKYQAAENGGSVHERIFTVTDMLAEAEAISSPLARQKSLQFLFKFRTAIPERISSDPDMILAIIINLATNAIKYTSTGFVAVELSFLDGNKLRIDVHDSGPGIDPELQPRVFERFVRQVPQGTEDEGGVGLGLPLSKTLAGLLGGDIGFSSRYGHGSTFWAEIPVKCIEDPRRAQETRIALFGLEALPQCDADSELRLLRGPQADAIFGEPGSHDSCADLVLIADPSRMSREDRERLWRFLDTTPAPLIAVEAGGPNGSQMFMRASALVSSPEALSGELIRTVANWHRRHQPSSRTAVQKPANNRTILVADDNRMNLQVTSRMLKLDGYTVFEAQTGDEALDLLLTRKVELALLDVNMPDQDGVEVCMTYRSVTAKEQAATVVGLTADISEETRSRCLAAGMIDVLTKPLDLQDLRTFLARAGQNTAPKHSGVTARTAHQADVAALDIERLKLLTELFSLDILKNDLLSKFETETIAHARRLQGGTSALPPAEMRAILHAIKSSALTIGAPRLAKLVSAPPEAQPNHAQSPSFENVMNELNLFLSSCRAFFDRECTQANPTFKSPAPGRCK